MARTKHTPPKKAAAAKGGPKAAVHVGGARKKSPATGGVKKRHKYKPGTVASAPPNPLLPEVD